MAELTEQFKNQFQHELNQILQWWSENMLDHQFGGFFGQTDFHGNVIQGAEKSIILNTRILWSFSAAGRSTGNSDYINLAHRSYHYLMAHFWDRDCGGFHWMVDAQGAPVNKRKQVYAQAFGIYALSEYYLLTGQTKALALAKYLFALVEEHCFDSEFDGYIEAFSEDWSEIGDMRLSVKDLNASKTMNTHLHIVEAYTHLYRIWKDAALRQSLVRLLNLFKARFIDQHHHLVLFFDRQWKQMSQTVSFGHDIECSWLLHETAELLHNKSLSNQIIGLAETSWSEGRGSDGSVVNEREGTQVDKDRHWWPQAEAVVGFWNAYQITKDDKYKDAALACWKYIKQYIIDHHHGEWHWRADANGRPIEIEGKAGPWKAPYHNTRMCIEMMRRLDKNTTPKK